MSNVEHNHRGSRLVDFVEHPPVAGEASTVNAGELFPQRFTDALGVIQQWAGDELHGRGGDVRWE